MKPIIKTPHKCALATMLLTGILAIDSHAIPANPNIIKDQQPNGDTIEYRLIGDEHGYRMETLDGYTIQENEGWYSYSLLDSTGKLTPSEFKVGIADPEALGIKTQLTSSDFHRKQAVKSIPTDSGTSRSMMMLNQSHPKGTIKNLVIPIRFSNHRNRDLPTTEQLDILFNEKNGHPDLAPTGSVRDVYLENSYQQLNLVSEVQPWVTVSNTEMHYANGNSGDATLWQGLKEALDEIDRTVDFRQFDADGDGYIDAIAFLHSGYGAEWGGTDSAGITTADRIWSHRWVMQPGWTSNEGVQVANYHISPALWGTTGSDIGRVGVIAHETGHFFGLPDLYDTDSGASGIGSYGLMANSWGFDGSQHCPPHMSPWSKERLGWINPTIISQESKYGLLEAQFNPEVFKITEGYPSGEYLMIENRQLAGFDCSLPQGGLAIWHIDESAGYNTEGFPGLDNWPHSGDHYRVALLQADGDYDLEQGWNRGDAQDLYHTDGVDTLPNFLQVYPNTNAYQGGNIIQSNFTISDISQSDKKMTFCLNDCGNQYTEVHKGLQATNLDWIHFTVDIPEGTTQLNATMSGGTGDADMWVVRDQRPDTTDDYNCIPFEVGNDETCYLKNPKSGTWYVSVTGFDDFSGVDLLIEYK